MRSPEEIKNAMRGCHSFGSCSECPYFSFQVTLGCKRQRNADALALIQQLEAELEDMTARYKIADDCAKKKSEMNEKLYAELSAVKAERDAAGEMIKKFLLMDARRGVQKEE